MFNTQLDIKRNDVDIVIDFIDSLPSLFDTLIESLVTNKKIKKKQMSMMNLSSDKKNKHKAFVKELTRINSIQNILDDTTLKDSINKVGLTGYTLHELTTNIQNKWDKIKHSIVENKNEIITLLNYINAILALLYLALNRYSDIISILIDTKDYIRTCFINI